MEEMTTSEYREGKLRELNTADGPSPSEKGDEGTP